MSLCIEFLVQMHIRCKEGYSVNFLHYIYAIILLGKLTVLLHVHSLDRTSTAQLIFQMGRMIVIINTCLSSDSIHY